MSFIGAAFGSSNTVSYSPTKGNGLVILFGDDYVSGTVVASVTDNKSTVYNVGMATTKTGDGLKDLSSFYLLNCPSGITSFTASFTSGSAGAHGILVLEYSNLQAYIGSAALKSNSAPGTGVNAITSNDINVTPVAATLIGLVYNPSNNTESAGTSPIAFTSRFATAGDSLFAEDAIITTAGNAHLTATTVNGSNNFHTTAMAFVNLVPPGMQML